MCCCSECVEKVIEAIRKVDAVLDVRVERLASKVVVVVKPAVGFNDRKSLLKNVKLKANENEASFVLLKDTDKNLPPPLEHIPESMEAKHNWQNLVITVDGLQVIKHQSMFTNLVLSRLDGDVL
jgi:copper chaperone CopZ